MLIYEGYTPKGEKVKYVTDYVFGCLGLKPTPIDPKSTTLPPLINKTVSGVLLSATLETLGWELKFDMVGKAVLGFYHINKRGEM